MKRTERIRTMMEKGQWKEGDSVYKLPKIKTIRIKIKKEKAEKATETVVTAEGAAPAAAAAPAKEASSAKGTAKASEKK